MLAIVPPTVLLLWFAAQGIAEAERSRAARARAVGEH